MADTLIAFSGNETGVKIDLHTNVKEYDGRRFDSSFAFVKAVEAKNATTGGTFVAKATASDTADTIEKLKKEIG